MEIQETWEKEGGGLGCDVGEYTWIGKKRKRQDSKNRGTEGVGFLANEFLCGIVRGDRRHIIRRKRMDKGTRGEGSEIFFLRKHLHASRVEEYGKRDAEEVRRDSGRCTGVKGKEKWF